MTAISVPTEFPVGRRSANPDNALTAAGLMLQAHHEVARAHAEVGRRIERSFTHLVHGARAVGMSWEEIGAHLAEPPTTIRSRYIKAPQEGGADPA